MTRSWRALTAWSGDDHFAWDVHRRFVQMYGDVVLGVDSTRFQEVLTELKGSAGVTDDSELSAGELETATRRFQAIVEEARPGQLPASPMDQLKGAITAVFESWNTKRAIEYRRINSIPDDLGTAANVQMMVFGDLGDDSGTGVCFTRDPSTGSRVIYGDYLPRAQGEDVVAGIRNTLSLDELAGLHPELPSAVDRDHGRPGGALPGHVRHRVHDRKGRPVHPADPRRKADRAGRGAHGGGHGR